MRNVLPVLVAGLLGGGIPALAQTAVPTFSDTVVVSAALDPEERDELPAAATVLGRDEIAARQSTDLAQLLSAVPGVAVAQAGSPGQQTSVFLRGAESDQTLLLWNGVALNDPYFGAINWQFVPTDGVERVEVVRGPFSALYGSNAVGGVVQVFTGSLEGGSVHLEGGGDDYFRGGVAAGHDAGAFRLDATGHVRRGDGELANDFFDSEELVARGLWKMAPGTSLGLLVRADDAETGIPLSGGVPTLNRRISWQEREVAVPFQIARGGWKLDAQLSDTRLDSGFRDPDDPFGFTSSDTRSQALRGRAVASWRRDAGLWASFGTDVERLEVDDRSAFGTNLDGARQRTWALFGEAGWGRGPLHLEAGVRRDDNDVYGGQTSLRGGAVVDLGAGFRLRASYGEAFRAPSLGELFFPFSGNPELRPETSQSWEVGVERSVAGVRLALTGFENRQHNLIDFDFVTFKDVNVGRARSRGVEAEADLRRGLFAARLGATYLEAEDLGTGLPLLRRPERSASVVLTARPGDFTFDLEGRYVGRRPDVDAVTFARAENPAYVRLDVAARWRATRRLSPYARVENVADRRYAQVLGYPSPGRRFVGGVAVDF
jgi:vitamin B12 transporter